MSLNKEKKRLQFKVSGLNSEILNKRRQHYKLWDNQLQRGSYGNKQTLFNNSKSALL